jgi:quercetin dioxygenase-like cupin family protein
VDVKKTTRTTVVGLAALAVAAFGSACGSSAPAASIDPVVAFPNNYSVIMENDTVRVLKITYAPGDKTAMHHHPDAIVVALTGTTTKFTMPDGSTQDVALAADAGNYMPGGEHSPENVGGSALDAILVEFKKPQPGTAMLPSAREGQTMNVLAEGPYGTAYRITAEPTFEEPEGTTHEYDQVVIALAPAEVTLNVEGQPTKTNWARGDVAFIGRNTPHGSKNTSGMAANYVLVEIK